MNSASKPRGRYSVVLSAVALAVGIAMGANLSGAKLRTFEAIAPYASPILACMICVHALETRSHRAHWAVPLILVTVLLDLAHRPHLNLLGGVGLTAGVLAIIATLFRFRIPAISATLICCVAVAASVVTS